MADGAGMTRPERRMELARDLRDRLRAEGRHADAEIVDDVVKSLRSSRSLNSVLHSDRAALQAIAEKAGRGDPD